MAIQKTFGRGLATGAQLMLVAFLSLGLTTTTHDSIANTLSSSQARVSVLAPSQKDLEAAAQTDRLDRAMEALSYKDAALYRMIFAAQQRKEWNKAEALQEQLVDKRLMGYVLSDRLTHRPARAEELAAWLKQYAVLPQASTIYALAVKAGVSRPTTPVAAEPWSSGDEAESAANFNAQMMVDSTAMDSQNKVLAQAVQKAVRKGDPWTARNLLLQAQAQRKLTGTFAHDTEAVVAASFFSVGEKDQAAALASAAAGAHQPLGLWVQGLLSWEKGDMDLAKRSFEALADHPALSANNRSAAHFWAYRVDAKRGQRGEARQHLQLASQAAPRSFYGMLAAQMMGDNPVGRYAATDKQPKWNASARTILASHPAGWRAMALIQVGQNDAAEAELRRLNPADDLDKQQAMMALATYVPMPALALKLAQLSKDDVAGASSLYPLLPWQPQEGYHIDRALLFALARHESLFETKAVSPRGARGLMQLMPNTAQVMAKDDPQGMSPQQLSDPSYNMALGQKYVQHLAGLPKIGGNLVLLLAAYNSGPGKAMGWAQSRSVNDPLLFLESLPVAETRNYVARVLPHYWAYRARLGKSVTSLRQLAEGKWPSVDVLEHKPTQMVQASR